MLSNRLLWPGMIGLALAVGLGVQMGESAVGDINPIHFQGAALRPQGIDPATQPPLTSSYAEAYGWEQGNQARLAEAGSYQDFNYVPQAMVRPAAAPVWREEAVPVSLAPWPPGQVSSHPEVERYTDYPIQEKVIDEPAPEPEAASEAVPPAPAPEPEPPTFVTTGK